MCRRHAGRIGRCNVLSPLGNVDQFDLNCRRWTNADASRLQTDGEAVMTHIAFANHAASVVILRHSVLAIPGAVLAAYAGVGIVENDTRDRIFTISVDRTAFQAGRLDAVVAPHRKVKALRAGIDTTLELTDFAPLQMRRVVVLLVARHLAAVTPDAPGHVEVETILFARTGCSGGDASCGRFAAWAAARRQSVLFADAAEGSVAG